MTVLAVEQVAVADLILDPNNSRRHSQRNLEAIAASLSKFGQRRPLVVHDGVVIAGNGTLQAAQALGWETISVTYAPAEWTLDEAKAYAIADNRTAELADWDSQQLLDTLQELDQELLEATGFDAVNLDDMDKVFGDVPDLDDLYKEVGEPTDEDGMTRISFMVPPEVAAHWEMAVKMAGSGSFLENVCTAIQAAYDAIVVDG